jgi:hypothetical protein
MWERVLGAVAVLGSACWLCVYPVLFVIAGLLLLVFVAQGNELLEATASAGDMGIKVLFHASVACWALVAWYCARVLLKRRFHGRFASGALDSDAPFVVFVRTWLPRALGAAIYASLAAFLFSAGENMQGIVAAACGIAYWLFVVYRRAIMPSREPAALRRETLDWWTHAMLAVALGVSFALLVGFLISPVALPRWLGAAPIILFAFTSWILFGSIVLVLLPKTYGLPSLALLPLFLGLVAGGVDNHEIRQATVPPGVQRAASIEASALAWLEGHAEEFRAARSRGDDTFPVYIASAEGGGLRAAYWTANVLGELELATQGRFSDRLFAISSVSGGSLGGAAFVAQVSTAVPCNSPEAVNVRNCLRYFLKGDFLAPVTAYLLFSDLLQRFLPFTPIRRFDRARAIELSWERSWAQTHPAANVNPFAESYDALMLAGRPVPRLFLNTTRVETGKRVLLSPARFDEDEMPEVDDLFAIGGRRWTTPLSTAVHLSARFSYVSPPAKICADAAETCDLDHVWGRLVDGGYHENSGAQSAVDLLRALRRAARTFEAAQPAGRTRIQPQVIIITNDVLSTRLCDEATPAEPAHWYAELLSPMRALWNSRVARGGQARRALADAAAGYRRDPLEKDCAGDRTRANTLEFSLASAQRRERTPALGWFLASGSTRVMDDALCRPEHLQAIANARRDLGVTTPYACGSARL